MPKITEGTFALGGLAFFSAWLLIVLPIMYLPTETHTQRQRHSSKTAQSATSEPKGTPQEPFFIKILPGDDAEEKAAQKAEDRLEKQTLERRIANWTVVLAIATIGLIGATAILGYFSFRQLRDTRASIDLAHRPKIRVKHLFLASNIWQGQPIIVNLTFVNIGTGQARVHQVGLRYEVVQRGRSLPPILLSTL